MRPLCATLDTDDVMIEDKEILRYASALPDAIEDQLRLLALDEPLFA